MMKLPFLFTCCVSGLTAAAQVRHTETGVITPAEAAAGVAIRRIPLGSAATPAARLQAGTYGAGTPTAGDTAATGSIHVVVGVDRKAPFALVAIPTRRAGGKEVLQSYTLLVEEPAVSGTAPLAKITSANSDLAGGSWHKIAVRDRGFYKVDYSFLTGKLGATGTIPSASIRLLGTGGTMLPEANSARMPDAPAEVALWMQDGGDGSFGAGDYFVFYAPGPTAWDADATTQGFRHRKNLYTDSAFYFLTLDGTAGLRIGSQAAAPAPVKTVRTSIWKVETKESSV